MGSVATEIKITSKKGELLSQAAIIELKNAVKCEIVFKGEAEEEVYRAAIDRFNKAWIAEAGIIVFVESEEEIGACLKYIQKYDLAMTIACGRHSYYGASSTDGGLVIDLSKMKAVSINQEAMSITAQGGCQAIDLETPLQTLGLSVVMGAANDTGIGGITLGGGSGPLTGQYGLVVDNLLAAKVVLANGDVLIASDKENSDLFWAIRGGGGNFGVVTEFTYRVYQQGDIFFGPFIFTPDKIHSLLSLAPHFKGLVDSTGGKLAVFYAFMKAPNMPAVHPVVIVFYDGPESEARSLLAPLYDLGPVAALARTAPYSTVTTPTPLTLGPLTHQHYATSYAPLIGEWDLDVIEECIADLGIFLEKYPSASPSKIVIEIRSFIKSGSVDPSAMALRARTPALMMVMESQHDGSVPNSNVVMRAELKRIMDKVRDATVAKHPENGKFFNANISSGMEKSAALFGENYARLRELKRKFDPGFVFDRWFPIPPAEA